MEIPIEPGATGYISGGLQTYEEKERAAFEARFGAIPSGLAYMEVVNAFRPHGGLIASVGVYSVVPPNQRPLVMPDGSTLPAPEPPPIPAEWAVYLANVKAAGAEQRRVREEERRAQKERNRAAVMSVIPGLEVTLDGYGRFDNQNWDDLELSIFPAEDGQDPQNFLGAISDAITSKVEVEGSWALEWVEGEDLGRVTITVKFHEMDSA